MLYAFCTNKFNFGLTFNIFCPPSISPCIIVIYFYNHILYLWELRPQLLLEGTLMLECLSFMKILCIVFTLSDLTLNLTHNRHDQYL